MHWYGGSIAEAVTLSKQKNAIFVVFVEGDNDLSNEMAATIEDASVVSRLSNQSNFLAVKLKSGTANYTHFAQIYQFVPVPSLFFIGRNGTPLEVVCAGVQPSNLATRIDRILAEHHLFVPVPSLFFFGRYSSPLEMICAGIQPADLASRIDRILAAYHGEKPPVAQPSTSSSSQGLQEATAGLLQSEANASVSVDIPGPAKTTPAEAPSPPKFPKPSEAAPAAVPKASDKPDEHEIVCDGDVCVRRPKAADQPSTSGAPTVVTPAVTPASAPSVIPPVVTETQNRPEASSSDTSVDEKLDRAKELIEAKRREKAEKEKELERLKELERRNTGQGVAELKRWQADQEMKHIQEERKREKLENDQARQRILEQIAQDRAERKARDNPAPAPTPLPTPSPVQQQTTSHLPTSGDGGNSARVQFKLPDGTSHTAHFDADGTLGQVQRYVADNLQLSASSFALWTAFPRRELTATSATLRELQLAPSAALLVLPRRTTEPAAGPKHYAGVYAFITQLLTTFIYEPSLVLYTWIRSRLFPPPGVAPRPAAPPAPAAPAAPAAPTAPSVPRTGPLLRRRTNIHRLPGDSANDDENNTWNGNSTQQM